MYGESFKSIMVPSEVSSFQLFGNSLLGWRLLAILTLTSTLTTYHLMAITISAKQPCYDLTLAVMTPEARSISKKTICTFLSLKIEKQMFTTFFLFTQLIYFYYGNSNYY